MTFFTILVVVVAGVFRMSQILPGQLSRLLPNQAFALGYAISSVVLLMGLWAGYRMVNVPIFADFLIAV